MIWHEHIAEFFGLPKRFQKDSEREALEFFLADCDEDGDGQVTWEELKAWDSRKQSDKKFKPGASANLECPTEDRLLQIFTACDKNNDGKQLRRPFRTTIRKSISGPYHTPRAWEYNRSYLSSR